MSKKMDELKVRAFENPAFRDGYEARTERLRLGTILKKVRERTGLTQEQLADRVGLTPVEVTRLESGLGHEGPAVFDVMHLLKTAGLGEPS